MSEDPRSPVWARMAEPLFRLGSGMFHEVYDRGWRPIRRLPVPVVSVGNLSAGGTGKTPTTRALARAARAEGSNPAILTRGYGGRRRGVVILDGKLDGRPARAEEVGDEPLWLSRMLPDVPVAVGPDRWAEGHRLLAETPIDLLLLDDGFQHRKLFRDRDLVLLDAARPFGNGRMLPAGPLREPPRALARADAILLVESGGDTPARDSRRQELPTLAPRASIRTARWKIERCRPLDPASPATDLRGRPLHAVAGIARPQRFVSLLDSEGFTVDGASFYRDHHRFTDDEILREEHRARTAGRIPVTTSKDAVRLEGRVDPRAGWQVVDVEIDVEGGWEAFLVQLRAGIKKDRDG